MALAVPNTALNYIIMIFSHSLAEVPDDDSCSGGLSVRVCIDGIDGIELTEQLFLGLEQRVVQDILKTFCVL